jgi:O-antigen biosynthesis protein
MPAAPPVSLLMPNRNNAEVLEHVLERLEANTTYGDVELVVVDDDSSDGSREILRRWRKSRRFRNFTLIERQHTDGGVIDALNEGLAAAGGELIVQLDADASIESQGWIERMVDFFSYDARVGVVTGKVVFDWGEVHTCGVDLLGPTGFHDRGARITERPGHRTYHQRVLRSLEEDCSVCEPAAEVDGGIGCCMMYPRAAALELGGYDRGYAPVWFDDLDLTVCLRREGLKVFYLPDVRVVHHVGVRLAREPPLVRAVRTVRRGAGSMLPPLTRRRISQRLGADRPPQEQWQRIQRHYAYWRQKWGFDMLNPDIEAVRRRWGHTEICWRFNDDMRAAGERIVAAFTAGQRRTIG